jgi:hypothetical protein
MPLMTVGIHIAAMKAMSSTGGFVKERIDKLDHTTRTLGYTVLEGGDPRYSHYAAEFHYACLGEATEATWTATFEPVGDMGPPYHLKATAPMVFKIFERVALAMRAFTHTEKLEGSPDSIWNAYRYCIENPPKVMPEDNSMAVSVEDSVEVAVVKGDECDKPGSNSVMKIVDPGTPLN